MSKKTILVGLLVILSMFFVAPGIVLAAEDVSSVSCSIVPWNAAACLTDVAAWFGTILQTISASYLAVAGTLLNGAMIMTLHMKETMEHVPAIESTWKIIRDFSNIFIIFLLLFAAIRMILGMKGLGFNELLKNIILAALLINFSLFFTKVAIDASNLVSLSFYNAIVPGKSITFDNNGNVSLKEIFNDGGISNLFMQGLGIQKIYKPSGFSEGSQQIMKTIVVSVGGSIVMFIAGTSFLVAALAFIIRIALFILLLAFSPIPFVAMIIPEASKFSSKWWGALKSQCIFMPIYLMLMYVAIKIISDPKFSAFLGNPADSNFWDNGGVVGPGMIGIIMQYVIAIILINVPLLVSLELSSATLGVGNAYAKKFTGKIKDWTKNGANAGGRLAFQNSVGRAASKFATNEKFQDFASKYKVGELALKGVRGSAAGYDKTLNEQVSTRTKFADSLGANQGRLIGLDRQRRADEADLKKKKDDLAAAKKSGVASPTVLATLEANVKTAEAKLSGTKTATLNEKTSRQRAYAERTGTSGTADTGFMYVARKNKAGAAQVMIKVKEAEKAEREKAKTKAEENLKKTKDAIDRTKEKKDRLNGMDPATRTAEQNRQLAEHTSKLTELEATKGDHELSLADAEAAHETVLSEIEELKTIK